VSTKQTESVGRISTFLVLCVFAMLTLLPFIYLVCGSLRLREDAATGIFLPVGDGWLGIGWERLTLGNFRTLLFEIGLTRSILNSVFLASVTSVAATLCCSMGGYALAKFRFAGQEFITKVVLATLVVPGVLLLAPTYQLLYRMGLLDSHAGLILPAAAPAFGVYLFRQSMLNSVPDELIEAARIDGCSELRTFFTIALPLVRPMVGAFLLITFVGTWNNFIGPQVILQSPEKMPLAVTVAQLKGVYSQDLGLLLAGTLISVVPVIVLFLLLQKDFISGLTTGAVKG
jgi:multiple sugar transport system permease protein